MREYRSERNERWAGFVHRPDDIVISTRSKSGTTWVQMICALLVFQTPDLPAPLAEISPWVDWDLAPIEVVRGRLEAQEHRRILKTHTPLDGLPLDRRVTYIVVGRDPLDVGLSLHHHVANLDRDRMQQLTGSPSSAPPPLSARVWMRWWIDADDRPEDQLDRLPGVVHHAADAWARRHQPNVVLVHYQDLTDDLEGEMHRLAHRLGIQVPDDRWPELVEAATFEAMRDRAVERVPDRLGVLKDDQAFFRSGRSGEGRALFDEDQLVRYQQRLVSMAPADLVAWLQH